MQPQKGINVTAGVLSFLWLCAFLWQGDLNTALAQKQLAPLPVKEAINTLNLPMFTPIRLSPDGKLVAYILRDSNRKARAKNSRSPEEMERMGIPRSVDFCDIWITDTATGRTKNLTQGLGTSWAPAWSPDGKYLAFYSDREDTPVLWIWERASATLRKASDTIVRTRLETTVPHEPQDIRISHDHVPYIRMHRRRPHPNEDLVVFRHGRIHGLDREHRFGRPVCVVNDRLHARRLLSPPLEPDLVSVV